MSITSPSLPSSAPLAHSIGEVPNVHLRLHGSRLPSSSYGSLQVDSVYNQRSMLLSEMCVVTVSVPADMAQTQKGRGAQLRFRFSPNTQIEWLRIAILKVCTHMYIRCFLYCIVCLLVCFEVECAIIIVRGFLPVTSPVPIATPVPISDHLHADLQRIHCVQ